MSGTASRSEVTDALILRVTDYRDADRILTLFTQHLGKVSAVARGARQSKRRFAGVLEPYAVIRVELEATRSELYTLKRAELDRVFPGILASFEKMDVAGAALALLREAHPARAPDVPMFVNAVQFLTLLELAGDPDRSRLLAFALRVLALSGLSPQLARCGRSGEVVPEGRPAYFDPALGAVVSRRLGGGPFLLSGAARARMLSALSDDWLSAAQASWPDAELKLARAAVAAFVAAHVKEELASRLFSG